MCIRDSGVVKQSGGYIYVYSESGRGTTFKIYLPQVSADLDVLLPDSEKRRSARGTETILFVEDEQSVRELVRDYLVGAGYCILEASDGVQALKVAAAHPGPVHMLITDVVMPHLSGPQLATKLSAERTDLKVLFISGYTDDTVSVSYTHLDVYKRQRERGCLPGSSELHLIRLEKN